jgi:hypothetical protein
MKFYKNTIVCIVCITIICSFGLICKNGFSQNTSNLRIGIANLEITSENSGNYFSLAGYGLVGSTGVHDPITARCLVIDDGSQKLAFITVDLAFGFSFSRGDPRMEEIAEKTHILPEKIFVSAIHTHAAPGMGNTNYHAHVLDVISDSIIKADSVLEPASVYFNSGVIEGRTMNRRNPEREPDGTVMTMQFFDANGECLATLINFACHPVILGPDNTLISADFVYYLRKRIEEEYGGTTLFFNRHAGGINPPGGWNRSGGTFEMAEDFGVSLAEDIIAIQASANSYDIKIQTRRNKTGQLDIALIDFGKAQILTIPGESLSEFGNQIDDILPGPYKFYFSLTNGHIGYIVPQSEWGKCTSTWTSSCYEETRSNPTFAERLEQGYREMAQEIF